jgi:taurine dioxygenase
MNIAASKMFEIIPLSKHIGAEIRGIDLNKPVDEATKKALHQAWLDHIVLIFRGQTLTQEAHMEATKIFGEPGHVGRPPKHFPEGFKRVLPGIMFISNIRENGEPIGALPDGEMMFHHDMIHHELPHKGTLLYSVEIPSQGGNTLFASGYAAYETLDPALRDKLENKIALHHYHYGSVQRGDDKGTEASAASKHPLFRTHEDSGRKAVYVNRLMTTGIEGMEDDDAMALLNPLFDHAEKEEFVYSHEWRVGDLLLWDNRCSSHARTDFPSTERRLMLRTTVRGEVIPY